MATAEANYCYAHLKPYKDKVDFGIWFDWEYDSMNYAKKMKVACKRERILVIADGAAFGPYIERLLDLSRIKNIAIYLPESFEWLILKSGLIKDASVKEVLRDPSEYIESKKYFSWEQFFTALLKEKTKGTYLVYNKAKLNPVYLHKNTSAAIMKEVPVNMP